MIIKISYIFIYEVSIKIFFMKKLFVFMFLIFIMSTTNESARGESNDMSGPDTKIEMETIICNVLGFVTGGVGKALAAFVCAGTALAFLAGKVSWTLVLTFTLGMACIFGAPTIIKVFTGTGEVACEGTSASSGS